jgi:predicted MFS family arabinose efflux permease
VVAAVGYALFGASRSLGWAAAWVGVAHLGGATLWVASTVLWQRHVAEGFRGRVFAFETLGMDVAFAAGGMFAGAVFDATGSRATATWATSGLVLALGAAWAWTARGLEGRLGPPDPAR